MFEKARQSSRTSVSSEDTMIALKGCFGRWKAWKTSWVSFVFFVWAHFFFFSGKLCCHRFLKQHIVLWKMKMKKWSSQWTQFMQLLKEAWKKFRTSTAFEPVKVLNFFHASLRNCINRVHCDDHFFIFISFPQFKYDLFHISLTLISFTGTYEPTIDLLPTSVAS